MEDSDDRVLMIQEKWRKEYEKTIPSKLKTLEDLILKMQSKIDEEDLKSFRREIHKMAGSAGTVGYMPVSVICKKIDQDLAFKLEHFNDEPQEMWISELNSYLKSITEAFSIK